MQVTALPRTATRLHRRYFMLCRVRRTLLLVSAIVCFETLFFTVLAPLLPVFSRRFHLSVAQAGLLSAAYAGGALIAAVPSGLAVARFGTRATALGGQTMLGLASIAFGIAPNAPAVFLARVAQGCGCSLAWTGGLTWLISQAPRERRGELIGIALGAAVAGALLGPAFGALASVAGAAPTFIGLSLPAFLLAGWGATIPDGPPQAVSLGAFRFALGQRNLARPALLIALAGLLLGLIGVLGPLRLSGLGWSAPSIAAVFLLSAAAQTSINPLLGRWSDRRGRLRPLRVGLIFSALGSIALAAAWGRWGYVFVVLLGGIAFSLIWGPSMALLSDRTANLGLGFGVGFALINLAWPPGQLLGSAGGAVLAQMTSNGTPYVVACALCLAGLLATRRNSSS